jgi:hypothetical protein
LVSEKPFLGMEAIIPRKAFVLIKGDKMANDKGYIERFHL